MNDSIFNKDDYTDRVLAYIKGRKQRIESGKFNCIPLPFNRFKRDLPGIEHGKLYGVTAYTKVGKTQFVNYLAVFHPLMMAYNNPDRIRVKILYYPLEESVLKITLRFMSYLIYEYTNHKYRVSVDILKSTDKDKLLPNEVLDVIESDDFKDVLHFFNTHVEFSETTNPTGINKELRTYAEEHGVVHKKDSYIKGPDGKPVLMKNHKFDYYEPDDPEEYRIVIVDHLSLLSTEQGMDQRKTMAKMSEYFMSLRKYYNYSIFSIQQQVVSEDTELLKMDRIRPSISNLGDNKATARDVDVFIGLFSPMQYSKSSYKGYDITKLKNNIRFMEILLNRDGEPGALDPLYFDGAISYFKELPRPDNIEGISQVYKLINKLNKGFILFQINFNFKNKLKRWLNY